MKTLKERLLRLLKDNDISQSQLADKIGCTRAAVNQWLRTGREPSPELLRKMAEILNTTPAYLLFGDEGTGHSIESEDGYILIPCIDVQASCGGGCNNDNPCLVKLVKVAQEWLRLHAPFANKRRLNIITAVGDSMIPTVHNGDMVILDTSQNTVRSDSMYAFIKDGELFLKRLQRIGNGLRVISDNQLYPPFELNDSDLERVKIIGRVCTIGRFQDM